MQSTYSLTACQVQRNKDKAATGHHEGSQKTLKQWCYASLAFVILFCLYSKQAFSQESSQPQHLTGLAEFHFLSATKLGQTARLIAGCHSTACQCFEVKIQNNSSEIVTIDGDLAQAEVAGNTIRAASVSELRHSLGCGLSLADKGLLSTASLVSLGLAGPLLYDFISKNPYPKAALGPDGTRHSIEIQRLGRRLLLPNDETTGYLCFPLKASTTVSTIRIPAHSITNSGRITIDTTH
ncbi:MAG: hypothetical protein HY711_06365 [Candidatus Melainabacteria bacterium]|nr:hypothetical protein [Candidatus Melainabacteria bacterium]